MASLIARRAFSTTARRLTNGQEALKSESKKNPEILVRQFPQQYPNPASQRTPSLLGGCDDAIDNIVANYTGKKKADCELVQ